MKKLLHQRCKIFFPNPYVIQVEFPNEIFADRLYREWSALTRKIYKDIQGTWGHTSVEYEQTTNIDLDSLFGNNSAMRGYICFQNELDALQVRLITNAKTRHVTMWPQNRIFQIHEYIE